MIDEKPTLRPRVRKRWIIAALVAIVAVQSVTITPGTTLRYLSDESGTPLEGLSVVAVWRLRSGNPGGSNDGGVIGFLETRTNQSGDVRIGATVMLHLPVFPFSPLYRDINQLPMVYVDDERYEPNVAASDLRPRPGATSSSFLIYQRSAFDGEILHLARSSATTESAHRDVVSREIQQARVECHESPICNEVDS